MTASTTLERKQAAQDEREAFAAEVRAGIRDRNLTARDVAAAIGVSPATLNGWLSGSTDPEPRALGDLAEVVGKSHLQLLALAGLLPSDLDDAALRLEASNQLRNAVGNLEVWTRAVARNTGENGIGAVASQILDIAGGQCEINVRPQIRGKRHPTFWDTEIIVGLHEHARVDAVALADALVDSCPTLRNPGALIDVSSDRTRLTLTVPRLLAPRVREPRPVRMPSQDLLVLGDPHTPTPVIASLVAEALGWSFETVRSLAAQQFDVTGEQASEPQRESAFNALLSSGSPARFVCWGLSVVDVGAESLLRIADQQDLLVVYLKSPHERDHQDHIAAAETAVGELDPENRLELSVPPKFNPSSAEDQVDIGIDLALESMQWLARTHEGPSLGALRGVLGSHWKSIVR